MLRLLQPRRLQCRLFHPQLGVRRPPPFPVTLHRSAATTASSSSSASDGLFRSDPRSLTLPCDSPLRIREPRHTGFKHVIRKLMLFYSKQGKLIRGAFALYKRIVSHVEDPAIYQVFNLERTSQTSLSLLELHMWLCLHRLKQEGGEGVDFVNCLLKIYHSDVSLRVSVPRVNLLQTKSLKELEEMFKRNVVAYDSAVLPEAEVDELQNAIGRLVFSNDGSSNPLDSTLQTIQAMTRYIRREASCLSLTDKAAIFSGNILFTPLDSK